MTFHLLNDLTHRSGLHILKIIFLAENMMKINTFCSCLFLNPIRPAVWRRLEVIRLYSV